MKIQGEHLLQASREQVWSAIVDLREFITELPGLQRLDSIGDNEYEGALQVIVDESASDFQGTLILSDLNAPSRLRFSLSGLGAAGFLDGHGLVVLEEESSGTTRLLFDFDAKVGGRIAAVAGAKLDDSALALAKRGLERWARRFPHAPKVKVRTRQKAAASAPASDTASASDTAPEPPAETPPADSEKAPAVAKAAAPAQAAPKTLPTNSARYGSQSSKALERPSFSVPGKPWFFGVALIVYTLVVILLTRACGA